MGVLAYRFLGRPAINVFGSFDPKQNVLLEITYENRVLRLVQQRRLLPYLLFGTFALRDIATNRDVLIWLTLGVKKRDYGCVYPVEASVFGTILYLTTPHFAARDRGPQISDELFRMISRVDDAVVLAEQFITGVF